VKPKVTSAIQGKGRSCSQSFTLITRSDRASCQRHPPQVSSPLSHSPWSSGLNARRIELLQHLIGLQLQPIELILIVAFIVMTLTSLMDAIERRLLEWSKGSTDVPG
jgi:hypothetical protein